VLCSHSHFDPHNQSQKLFLDIIKHPENGEEVTSQ
jgi:hypothetical protein